MKIANYRPLFFLFTCVKDGRKYITRLFDSLLSQTSINFIHYIYEDGSTDPITDLVEKYKEKASFQVIYEFNKTNIGLNKSTMHCIQRCNLPFFIWIDCDNWVDSHFFEELEKMYRKNKKAVVLRSRRVLIDSKDNSVINSRDSTIQIESLKNQRLYSPYLIFDNYYYSFFAVSKASYTKVNSSFFMLDEKSFFNDQQVLFACSKFRNKFAYNEKAVGFCLIRNDSESADNFLQNESDRIDYFSRLNSVLHINKYDYEEIKLCTELQKQHLALFSAHDFVQARKKLSKKRKLFLKNRIKNSIYPFCDKSFFSLLYYFFPRVCGLIYKHFRKR